MEEEDLADRRTQRRMRVFLTVFVACTTVIYRYTGHDATADRVAAGLTILMILWWFGIQVKSAE